MNRSILPLAKGFFNGRYCIGSAKLSRSMATMMANVYEGPGKPVWKKVEKPTIKEPTDVIIKITCTTICGTDLHICKGDVPGCKPGTTLGHEGIGIIEEVGSNVQKFKKGDKVIISCITSCGNCWYCKKNMQSHCLNEGGWILGHKINGTQAEYTRIPHADHSLFHVPKGANDRQLLMLSDILPTGYEIGVLPANIEKGDTVAIVGAGPIGLAALVTCQKFQPAKIIMIDTNEDRLQNAKANFGATDIINPSKVSSVKEEAYKIAREGNKLRTKETLEPGVDVAIECVGIPKSMDICQEIIASGGRITNVGVHGTKVDLQLQDLWIKNITLSTGLVNTYSTPELLSKIQEGGLDPSKFITHDFKLCDICKAYDCFGNAAANHAVKMFIEA